MTKSSKKCQKMTRYLGKSAMLVCWAFFLMSAPQVAFAQDLPANLLNDAKVLKKTKAILNAALRAGEGSKNTPAILASIITCSTCYRGYVGVAPKPICLDPKTLMLMCVACGINLGEATR